MPRLKEHLRTLRTAAALVLLLALADSRIGGDGGFSPAEDDPALTMRLDLNGASPRDLESLPGVGPVLADRIDRARRKRGGYRDVEDLLEVRGIGPVRLAALEPYLEVGGKGLSVRAVNDVVGRR